MAKKSSKTEALAIIHNILRYCEEEKRSGSYIFPVDQVINRVAAMTGKSTRTILRIRKELPQDEESEAQTTISEVSQPSTSFQNIDIKINPRTIDLDDTDRCILRNKIISLYTVSKTVPTLKTLHRFMVEEIGFGGCKETLRKIILKMGYKYKKCQSNRKYLVERQDIVAWRARYLRFLMDNDKLGDHKRPVIYLDESYVHKNYTVSKCWQSDNTKGVLKKDGAGQRWIMGHAGGRMGFIDNCLLLFKSKTKSGDYHDDMNFENFYKWFTEQLIPNIPNNSIIVMDNASYHSVQINKPPTASSRKGDIISWLQSKRLPYHSAMLKCELLELVKIHKPPPEYEIDNYAMKKGHTVIRLPPYHCDLNPIELIWSMVKRKVAASNVDSSSNLEALIRQAFQEITPDLWQAECNHVKKIEKKYIERDQLLDDEYEFIIHLSENESDSDMELDSDGDI